jgi:dCTP deaminase
MLLSDIDIAKRLVDPDPSRRLLITPIVNAQQQFGPSSLDVRLSTDFQYLLELNVSHIPASGWLPNRPYGRKLNLAANESFFLHPGEFVLASTLEWLRLPDDLAGRIEGRSSLGRQGLLVHATAGFVDPGFAGVLTFELSNAGRIPIELKVGTRIGQVCFFEMTSRSLIPYPKKHNAKYYEATGVETSKAGVDPEVATLQNPTQKQP